MMKTASQCRTVRVTSWSVQVVLAGALVALGALPKLTGDPYAVALFSKLGFEPGRFLVGGAEALAVVLLLTPRAHALGGLLALGLMFGAIGSHLGPLGLETELVVGGETTTNPALFPMSVALFVLSALVVWLRRDELPVIGPALGGRGRGAQAAEVPR